MGWERERETSELENNTEELNREREKQKIKVTFLRCNGMLRRVVYER